MTTEANQTVSTDAREASKSRVQTQDTVLASLTPPAAAKEQPDGQKPKDEDSKDDGESRPKKGAQERIRELAGQRKEAEAKADAAERRAAELEAQVLALSASAKPMEAQAKPLRSQFTTDDEYIDALTDWKAREAIARREQEQATARAEAEQAEIAAQWSKRQEAVMKELPDYADVLGKSETSIPAHVHQAILESDQGPQIAYYLALHPEEAKRIATMNPISAIKRIAALERDLSEIEKDDPPAKKEDPATPQKSKAPPPIDPVKSVPSASATSTGSYEEYKRRRQATKK